MSMNAAPPALQPVAAVRFPELRFAAGFAGIAVVAAVLAGTLPVWFSIAAVFLFAGPHNWLEARYVLGRLPARVGKLRWYFLLSATGVVGLTAGYAALPWLVRELTGSTPAGLPYAGWNTAFLFWVATLIWMRSRTNPRFDGGWVWPLAFLLTAGVWLNPVVLNVALVYLHPLVAVVLLDRELGRSRPTWRPAYRGAVLLIPVLFGGLWWQLHAAPDLPGDDPLTAAIVNHSGAWLLDGVSTHFLVAAHTFLEMVHYGVWVILIPLVGMRSWPWELRTVPAARRGPAWARCVTATLVTGLGVVVVLWACFLLDYGTTRSVYFTVAMSHVLAEIPFLLRMV